MTLDRLIDDLQYYQQQGKGKCTVVGLDNDNRLIAVDEIDDNIVLILHDDLQREIC